VAEIPRELDRGRQQRAKGVKHRQVGREGGRKLEQDHGQFLAQRRGSLDQLRNLLIAAPKNLLVPNSKIKRTKKKKKKKKTVCKEWGGKKKKKSKEGNQSAFSWVILPGALTAKRNPFGELSFHFLNVSSVGRPWKDVLISTQGKVSA
jgi:hypothetical protein